MTKADVFHQKTLRSPKMLQLSLLIDLRRTPWTSCGLKFLRERYVAGSLSSETSRFSILIFFVVYSYGIAQEEQKRRNQGAGYRRHENIGGKGELYGPFAKAPNAGRQSLGSRLLITGGLESWFPPSMIGLSFDMSEISSCSGLLPQISITPTIVDEVLWDDRFDALSMMISQAVHQKWGGLGVNPFSN